MLYHNKYKNFNPAAIKAVRDIIKEGLFRNKDLEVRKILINRLHIKLCEIYELPITTIVYMNIDHFGSYNLITNNITLNKPSLVTYLHEFAHYKFIFKHERNSEHKARAWSISLFYQATPKLCEAAIVSGKIIHQNTMDDVVRESVPVENLTMNNNEINPLLNFLDKNNRSLE